MSPCRSRWLSSYATLQLVTEWKQMNTPTPQHSLKMSPAWDTAHHRAAPPVSGAVGDSSHCTLCSASHERTACSCPSSAGARPGSTRAALQA